MLPLLMVLLIAALSYFFFCKYIAPILVGRAANQNGIANLYDQIMKTATSAYGRSPMATQPSRSTMTARPALSTVTAQPAQSTLTAQSSTSNANATSTKESSSIEMPVSIGLLSSTTAFQGKPAFDNKNVKVEEVAITKTGNGEIEKPIEDSAVKKSTAENSPAALVPYPDKSNQGAPELSIQDSASTSTVPIAAPGISVPDGPTSTVSLPTGQPSSILSDAPPQKNLKKKKSHRHKKSKSAEKKSKKNSSQRTRTSEDKIGEGKKKSHGKKKKKHKHKSNRDKSSSPKKEDGEEQPPQPQK